MADGQDHGSMDHGSIYPDGDVKGQKVHENVVTGDGSEMGALYPPSCYDLDQVEMSEDEEEGPTSSADNIIPPNLRNGWNAVTGFFASTAQKIADNEQIKNLRQKTAEGGATAWQKTTEVVAPAWERTVEVATTHIHIHIHTYNAHTYNTYTHITHTYTHITHIHTHITHTHTGGYPAVGEYMHGCVEFVREE
jgi:hypothetical protein